MEKRNTMGLGILSILICCLLWASDTIFRQPLTKHLDSTAIVLLEHLVCVFFTFPILFFRQKELNKINFRSFFSIVFIGIFGSALATYFFTTSYQFINPSIGILLQKLQPIFVILAARIFLKEKPSIRFYLFTPIAIIASLLISFPDGIIFNNINYQNQMKGIAYAIGAALLWSMSTILGKFVTKSISFPLIVSLRFFWGLVGMVLLFLTNIFVTKTSAINLYYFFKAETHFIFSILFISLGSGVLAMNFYYAGLKKTPASLVAILEMAFPLFAVIINWLYLNQPLTLTQLNAATLLVFSTYQIRKGIS